MKKPNSAEVEMTFLASLSKLNVVLRTLHKQVLMFHQIFMELTKIAKEIPFVSIVFKLKLDFEIFYTKPHISVIEVYHSPNELCMNISSFMLYANENSRLSFFLEKPKADGKYLSFSRKIEFSGVCEFF
jgi:hypothetical protein